MVTENKPQQDNNNSNIVNENTNDEFVEQFWVKNVLPHKVETLPYEKLSVEEQKIISKIRNNETLTNDELKTIVDTVEFSQIQEKPFSIINNPYVLIGAAIGGIVVLIISIIAISITNKKEE